MKLSGRTGAQDADLVRLHAWARRLRRLRPAALGSLALGMLAQRWIVDAEGIRILIDPTTHLGDEVLSNGTYEPDTVRLFRENLRPGDTMLDIGANEGFFAALAAALVGPHGTVLAVEPQSRLHEVLEINLALNAKGRTAIIKRVVGETDSATRRIWLFPISNTGASSLVSRYRFGAKSEEVREITPTTILRDAGLKRVDFIKIDVEGFEPEVVRALVPLMRSGQIGTLLLDYHGGILASRGIDPAETHALVASCGMGATEGDVGRGYVLYKQV